MKHKEYYIVVLMIILALLTGCASSPEVSEEQIEVTEKQTEVTVTVKEVIDVVEHEKSVYYEIDIVLPKIQGLSDHKVQKQINDVIQRDLGSYIEEMKSFVKEMDYTEVYTEEQLTSVQYAVSAQYTVHTLSDSILSLTVGIYEYTGGAHGNYWDVAFNFDLETGQAYTLKEYYQNPDYLQYVDKVIKEELDREKESVFEDAFQSFKENGQFYIANDRPYIFFNPYEVANYARGIVQIPLSQTLPQTVKDEKEIIWGQDLLMNNQNDQSLNVLTEIILDKGWESSPHVSKDMLAVQNLLTDLGYWGYEVYSYIELKDLFERKEVTHIIKLMNNENIAAYIQVLNGNQVVFSFNKPVQDSDKIYLSKSSAWMTEEWIQSLDMFLNAD